MYKKYQNFLTAILIFAMSFFCSYSVFSQTMPLSTPFDGDPPVLSGENSIDNVKIIKDQLGIVKVTFDYYYTGDPFVASLYAVAKVPETAMHKVVPFMLKPQRGKHSIEIEVTSPRSIDPSVTVTQFIKVGMNQGMETPPIVEKVIPHVIEWESVEELYWIRKFATLSVNQLYEESVAFIDNGNVNEAKRILEQIILKDANFAPAYVEMARVAMKTNWNVEGLSQAEKYIQTALKINPSDVNANVLIGYVYTHQKRFPEAEKAFKIAEKASTKNLWLWANWGQLLVAQDKSQEAIQKYLVAVDGARPYNTYDRARLDAYKNLFNLLNNSSDKNKKDALYKKRGEEFNNACFIQEYAYFKLTAMSDYKSAIDLAKLSIDRGCIDERAKSTMGLAHYHAWLNSSDDFSLLAKAKVFYPDGPGLFYDLAKTDSGINIIKKLIKDGTPIDIADAETRTALSLALFNRDSISAKALISLGADVNHVLGKEQFPIAFIPLMYNDQKSIALMKESGIDYQKIKFNGLTASEFMQQNSAFGNGNKSL